MTIDKDELSKSIAAKEEAKELLNLFGLNAKGISMEEAGEVYRSMLADEAAKQFRSACDLIGLLAIAANPTKIQAMKAYTDMLEIATEQSRKFGTELISKEFEKEKKHTEEKLDLLVKTALSI